jgi:hypothetical protein
MKFRDNVEPRINKDGIPYCSDRCPSHDGKRCEIIGASPSLICEPAVQDMAARLNEAPGAATPQMILDWLLTRVGSWTSARFDQHARHEFGDEATDRFLAWLREQGVKP